jgi:hypothetical protein
VSLGEALYDQSCSAGAEMAFGFALGKVVRVGKKVGSALVKSENALTHIVIKTIAEKNCVITREKRWMQLAAEGKLSKEVIETIKRTGGKKVYEIHGLELAHRPGKPAAGGYDYSNALPKTKSIHRNQHRFYTDMPEGGFSLKMPPRKDNSWIHPRPDVFKRLNQIEQQVKE